VVGGGASVGGGTAGAAATTSEKGQDDPYVSNTGTSGSFPLSVDGTPAPIVYNKTDFAGVARVAKHLQTDLGAVTGTKPTLAEDTVPAGAKNVVLIGTLGKSALIDGLVASGKLSVTAIRGKWENFIVQVVEQPMANVDRALVIVGSDKRGTLYGMYDVSSHIGVSPWYWWADVPIRKQSSLYVLPGAHTLGTPAVKYRGIFINDEAPALSGMVGEKFGGFNSKFYDKVFELVLRLKGNYLWPAMWGTAFATNDPLSPALADEYGVVMGTSHHEPMTRAQQEWTVNHSNAADWDYTTNSTALKDFWRGGIKRMGTRENLVTVGMRGDGDVAMSATANIDLLQKIIADQRTILQEVTGKDPATIPQVWTVYKEVQEYYEKGLKVPDDVSIIFADDNWGNIRTLPKGGQTRTGGFGVYYHYDYVGGPRSYRWLNTNNISRVWEQMHLAYETGARQVWIVNVGDIKPMEFPTEFFLDYAWKADKFAAAQLPEWSRKWAERQFGAKYAQEIARLVTRYAMFSSRRKPELLEPATYSLTDYREAETVVTDYYQLLADAQAVDAALPTGDHDAFYELVLHPIKASATLNDMYVSAAKNSLFAAQGRASTADMAKKVTDLFAADAAIATEYHKIAGGKWNHMMDQTHIGYTSWDNPAKNVMPTVKQVTVPAAASMGVALEGSSSWWPNQTGTAALPVLSPYSVPADRYIDVFNRGSTAFEFTAKPSVDWVTVKPASGTVTKEQRLAITVDWARATKGTSNVPITITGPGGTSVAVQLALNNPEVTQVKGFVESNGYVSIEAEHYSSAVDGTDVKWNVIPNLGRTFSGVTALPATATSQASPSGASPHLEYGIHLFTSGPIKVKAYFSPTLKFGGAALRYGVSVDGGAVTTASVDLAADSGSWSTAVTNNVYTSTTTLSVSGVGAHTVKFWRMDGGLVLQKLVLETSGAKASYLGPPESMLRN
jgi:hypothetical protein